MGIEKISILQRLEPPQIEGQLHRWATSEDCTSLPRTKILTGKFLTDLSWLLVASSVKRVSFNIRSLNEKIVYQISGSSDSLKTVNFKIENDVMVPVMFEHVPKEASDHVDVEPDDHGLNSQTLSDVVELRRSKRRNIQPERFLGCDVSKLNINPYRSGLVKWKPEIDEDDELHLPLSVLFGKRRKGHAGDCQNLMLSLVRREIQTDMVELKEGDGNVMTNRLRKPGSGRKRGRKSKLAILQMEPENSLVSFGQYNTLNKSEKLIDWSGEGGGYGVGNVGYGGGSGGHGVGSGRYGGGNPFGYYPEKTPSERKKNCKDLDDMGLDFGMSWVRNASDKKAERRKYYRLPPKRNYMNEERIYGQRTLSAGLYKDLINSYMKSIDSTKIKDDVPLIDQWREFQSRSKASYKKGMGLDPIINEPEEEEEEEEESELDMLWREMELCMTSSYLFEDNEARILGAIRCINAFPYVKSNCLVHLL